MKYRDLHVHTRFSDGEDTPETMVRAAIEAGMTAIGFSDHSPTPFDHSYCLPPAQVAAYRETVTALKQTYRDRIEILHGIEQDYYAGRPTEPYDYVIGSVHYLRCGDLYVPVDEDADTLRGAVDRCFGGDPYAMVEEYYRTVGDVVRQTGATIIGHFDLITKFHEESPFFDTRHPRYLAAWQAAADRLLSTGVPFEINTGAIARGHRTQPYPADDIRDYLRRHGASFLLASDSHAASFLCFLFDNYRHEV